MSDSRLYLPHVLLVLGTCRHARVGLNYICTVSIFWVPRINEPFTKGERQKKKARLFLMLLLLSHPESTDMQGD